MSSRKIALLLGQAYEEYQCEFIDGVMKRAAVLDYDVCVFSMYIKYQNNKEREIGDSNIFNLINYDLFDAVIVMSDTLQTPGLVQEVEEKIHKSFNGPVVCVDTNSKYFYSFWTDGYNAVYATVSHMIEKHGYKDIAYLTGRKNHAHSKRRLTAYINAMKDHGLSIKDSRMYDGDFWYTSGTACAENLLRNRNDLPEAIVCANDCMAIGLANELTSNGVRIPDDIALAGYGTGEEGQCSPKPITSTYIPAEYYGKYAVDCLMKLLKGKEPKEPNPEAELFIGESCGCKPDSKEKYSKKRDSWMTNDLEEGFYSVHNNMMEDMLLADTLSDLFNVAYENLFFLRGVKSFDFCLGDQWLNDELLYKNAFPKTSYAKKSVNILSYSVDDPSICRVGEDRVFDTKDLFPHDIDEEPNCYLFMPLFFEDKNFGYGIISYGTEVKKFSEVIRHWMRMITRGLEEYRRKYVINALEMRYTLKSDNKYPTLYASDEQIQKGIERLNDEEREELEIVKDILDNNKLTYYFQPIVKASDGEIFSYEALMRSNTEKKISPLEIIKMADLLDRLSDVEKATFINVLTYAEKHKDSFEKKKIFINSIPGCDVEGEDEKRIEELLEEFSGTAVVELTEQAEVEDERLDDLKDKFSRYGTGLAVDDYGTGYSNVGNLLRYMPDYVKIDRSLLSEIQTNSQKQHFVREIIDFCHANNIMALAEGVETTEELEAVIRLGADLIQGFYLAKPTPEVVPSIDSNKKMEVLRFRRELEEGASETTYVAGRTNRISINNLLKNNKTTIVIGEKDVTFRDISIVGTPNVDTNIHIEILEGYDGRVTLENVNLSTKKNRPCIDLADNTKLTLSLVGENKLSGGGIRVPESSKLVIDGDGNLKISISGQEAYGIGAELDKTHGTLEFYQDGEIYIDMNGQSMIGVGSGLGGNIRISRGKYTFMLTGDKGVGMGSYEGNQPIIIHDCDLMMDNSFHYGVCIGSVENSTSVEVWHSLIRCSGAGKQLSLIGSVNGEKAEVTLRDLTYIGGLRSDNSTALGSINGSSRIKIDTAAYKFKGVGKQAYVYGGHNDNNDIVIVNSNINVDLVSDSGKIVYGSEDSVKEEFVLKDIRVNGRIAE